VRRNKLHLITFIRPLFLIAALVGVVSTSFAWAGDLYSVRVRDEHGAIVVQPLEIPALIREGFAETSRFKVVNHRDSEALALDHSPDGERAATVLYHLEYAYAKMLPRVGSETMNGLGQVVVRLNTPNQFSSTVHFVREELDPLFNNISAIPTSDDDRMEKYPAWGSELWIRPVKAESVPSGFKAFDDQSKQVRGVMLEGTVASVTTQFAQSSSAYNHLVDPVLHLQQLGVGIALSVGLPELFAWIGRNTNKTVELDAAMVPEILYHEFAHLALSKWAPIGMSTPVLEGYANFFALEISGLKEIAVKLGSYGKNFKGPEAKGVSRYQVLHENSDYAWEGFTVQLLERVRDTLGDELGSRVIVDSVRMLYHSKKPINEINIKYDLCSNLKQAVRKLSPPEDQLLNQMKLNRVYKMFGLVD
jgi:hypothetical protein